MPRSGGRSASPGRRLTAVSDGRAPANRISPTNGRSFAAHRAEAHLPLSQSGQLLDGLFAFFDEACSHSCAAAGKPWSCADAPCW